MLTKFLQFEEMFFKLQELTVRGSIADKPVADAGERTFWKPPSCPIARLWGKKAVKNGPLRPICSPTFPKSDRLLEREMQAQRVVQQAHFFW